MAEINIKEKMNTVVITPSIAPGRVAIRVYKDGEVLQARLAGDCRQSILTVLDLILENMGVER